MAGPNDYSVPREKLADALRLVLGSGAQVSPEDARTYSPRGADYKLRCKLAHMASLLYLRGFLRLVPSFDRREYALRYRACDKPLMVFALSERGAGLLEICPLEEADDAA